LQPILECEKLVNYQLLVWRLANQCKPPGDRPQSELKSKTRELALGDGSGPVRRCVVIVLLGSSRWVW